MNFPCCMWDSPKNREIGMAMVENHLKTTGEKFVLVVIDKKLQVRKPEYLEKHKGRINYTVV